MFLSCGADHALSGCCSGPISKTYRDFDHSSPGVSHVFVYQVILTCWNLQENAIQETLRLPNHNPGAFFHLWVKVMVKAHSLWHCEIQGFYKNPLKHHLTPICFKWVLTFWTWDSSLFKVNVFLCCSKRWTGYSTWCKESFERPFLGAFFRHLRLASPKVSGNERLGNPRCGNGKSSIFPHDEQTRLQQGGCLGMVDDDLCLFWGVKLVCLIFRKEIGSYN